MSNGPSSAPSKPAGGGGGDLMSEMQMKLQKRLKLSGSGDSKSAAPSSGRTSPPSTGHSRTQSDTSSKKPWEKDTKQSGPPTVNRFDRFGSKSNGTANDAQVGSPKLKRRGSTHSNGSLNDGDFEKLKQEILSEIRTQLNEVKQEIIEAVRAELSKR